MANEYFKSFNNMHYQYMNSNVNKMKRKSYSGNASVYGALLLNPSSKTKYIYAFKILNKHPYGGICIGITDKPDINKCFYQQSQANSYAYGSSGTFYVGGNSGKKWEKYKRNDVISMSIDFNDDRICFSKNGNKFDEQTINKPQHPYYIAVYLNAIGDSISLESFKYISSGSVIGSVIDNGICSDNGDDDSKQKECISCQKLKVCHSLLI